MSLAPGDLDKLNSALVSWSREHPQHSNQPLVSPLNMRPNVQIHFPESDGVSYIDCANTMAQIDAKQGIDVLTSVGDLDFDVFMSRARTTSVQGLTIHYLSRYDLKQTEKPRK